MKFRSLLLFLAGVSFAVLSAAMSDAEAQGGRRKNKNKDASAVLKPLAILKEAPADAWRPIDLENTLVMDLPAGEVVIELRPDFAPAHVERLKKLAREGFYTNVTFHRVIEGFVAQGGDPKGDGTGGSPYPDLPPEFSREISLVNDFVELGRERLAARAGFIDGMPVAAHPATLSTFIPTRTPMIWGAHCPGVMSMARATLPNSANSQFFLMIGDARTSLDQRYSVWGRIIDGFENTRRIERGEPPKRPTPIVRLRVAADMPKDEQPNIEILKTSRSEFREYAEALNLIKDGLVPDLCKIRTPARINGKIEL